MGGRSVAVVSVTAFQISPNGSEAAMQWLRKTKAFLEGSGARSVRLLSALVGGEATGTMAFLTESEDFAHNGSISDKFLADPELASGMVEAISTGAFLGVQTSLWMDVLQTAAGPPAFVV